VQLSGSCRPGVRYLLRDYRLARLILLQIHRPVRGLDLDIELPALAGKLIDAGTNSGDVERPNQSNLRAAVARLLLRRASATAFRDPCNTPRTSRRASACVNVIPEPNRANELVWLMLAIKRSSSSAT
jgi:hypothetical protein